MSTKPDQAQLPGIVARIGPLDGADPEPCGGDTTAYVFLRPDDPTRPDGQQTWSAG